MTLDEFLNVALRVPSLVWIASVLDSTWTTVMWTKYMENTAFLCINVGYLLALQLLPLAEVKKQYRYLLATALICVGSAYTYTEGHRANELVNYLVLKTVAGTFVALLLGFKSWNRWIPFAYTIPALLKIAGLPAGLVYNVQTYSAVLTVSVGVLQMIWSLLLSLFKELSDFGRLSAVLGLPVIQHYWVNRSLSMQFLVMWIIRFAFCFFIVWPSERYSVLVICLFAVSFTLMSPLYLFAFCITISYVSYVILSLAKLFILKGIDVTIDKDLSSGWLQGFMAVLAVLISDFNYFKLTIVESRGLMISIFIHTTFGLYFSLRDIMQPVIESLYIPRVRPVGVYFRVSIFSAVAFMLPLYTSYVLLTTFDLSVTWKFALLEQVLVSLQIFESLFICCLFSYDARNNGTWELLDDIVFYIRASVGVLQFIIYVLYFLTALFAKVSYIFYMYLFCFGYACIWIPLQNGWKTYNLRKTVIQRIERLPTATRDQLRNHNDDCAICFHHLGTACITNCGHFFHSVCLKKWLHVQDVCPVCRQPVSPPGRA